MLSSLFPGLRGGELPQKQTRRLERMKSLRASCVVDVILQLEQRALVEVKGDRVILGVGGKSRRRRHKLVCPLFTRTW